MKSCSKLLLLVCLASLAIPCYPQGQVVRVEIAASRDAKRTAHRFHMTPAQLTNARAALDEATGIALRQDPPPVTDFGTLARLWTQLDRKKSVSMIATMIEQMIKRAQESEDLSSYSKYTSAGQQLLYSLGQMDPDKAEQIAVLWPAPSSKLGEAGEKAASQFQTEFTSRFMQLASMNGGLGGGGNQYLDVLLQPQRIASMPFANRGQLAEMLTYYDQSEKARQLMDQSVQDFAKIVSDPGKNSDYEGFLRSIASIYPEKFMTAYEGYLNAISRQSPATNPGVILQIGERKVLLTPSESATLNVVRNMYARPALAMQLLDSSPGLRAKLDTLGGVDKVLSPNGFPGDPRPVSYPANGTPPPAAPRPPNPNAEGSTGQEKLLTSGELFRTLRGKADTSPDEVRRRLLDTCRKKEYFQILIQLAQTARSTDPELSSIALDVAHGLLPLIDPLAQRSNSLRNLIDALRMLDGDVDPALYKEGFILVGEMRDEENQKQQGAPNKAASLPPGGNPSAPAQSLHPSESLEISLIALTAMDDLSAAMRSVHAIEDEGVRAKALLQIIQNLMSNY